MLYVRVSSFSSVMVQVPSSRDVWTSSFNAVKRVPSCSVTAFSIGSCWPAVWVAWPSCQQQKNHRCSSNPLTEMHLFPCTFLTLTNNPSEHQCKKFSYHSQICPWPSGFSFLQLASPLHRALCRPATGPAAVGRY